jgi:hypothetical protein
MTTTTDRTFWEKVELTGEHVAAKIKELIEAGNVRRIRVKQKDKIIAEFPLTIGVLGTLIAPVAAAIGALMAVVTECSIEVERTAKP